MQLDPVTYNKGMIGGFKQVIAGEGAGALLTGLGPTASGYFIQGWFKFGGDLKTHIPTHQPVGGASGSMRIFLPCRSSEFELDAP